MNYQLISGYAQGIKLLTKYNLKQKNYSRLGSKLFYGEILFIPSSRQSHLSAEDYVDLKDSKIITLPQDRRDDYLIVR